MRPHEPGRSSGRAPRPQGAAVGRTAASLARRLFGGQGGGGAGPRKEHHFIKNTTANNCARPAGRKLT